MYVILCLREFLSVFILYEAFTLTFFYDRTRSSSAFDLYHVFE